MFLYEYGNITEYLCTVIWSKFNNKYTTATVTNCSSLIVNTVISAVILLTAFYFSVAKNSLDIAIAYGDPTIITMVKEKMDSVLKLKEGAKGKGGKAPKSKVPA